MDIDQIITLLSDLGDVGTLIGGVASAIEGIVEFGGSVESLLSGS